MTWGPTDEEVRAFREDHEKIDLEPYKSPSLYYAALLRAAWAVSPGPGLEEELADKRRLTRELDVAMCGEEGAAKQASLCDLIGSAKALRVRVAELEKTLRCQDLRVEELRSANDKWRSYFTTTKEETDD